MKKLKKINLLLLCIFTLSLSAQEVMEAEKVMSKGLNNSVSIELSNVDNKQVDVWWRDFIRAYTKKVKKDRKSKEWFADDATITDINASTPIDMYTKIESAGKYIAVTTWVDLGTGYLSSTDNPDAYAGLEKIMLAFEHHVATEKVNIELASEEKNLKKLQNELKKLQNQNNTYHKQIENANAKIAKAEEDIRKNLESQESMQTTIESQIKMVEDVRIKLNEMNNKTPGKNEK